jgi:hypothetical protein
VTTLSVDTASINIGGYYAPSAWVPPTGTVFVGGSVQIQNNSGSTAGFVLYLYYGSTAIYQQGSPLVTAGNVFSLAVGGISQSDGGNGYSLRVNASAQPYAVLGGIALSFYGYMV